MKKTYLNMEIQSQLNEAAVNKDKSGNPKQRIFVKATIAVMKVVAALKEIEKLVKRRYQRKTLNKIILNDFPHAT